MGRRGGIGGSGIGAASAVGGDVTGTLGATVVSAISGASPILITPNVLEWTNGTTTPTLTVATPTSDVATVPLLIQSQAPWASAATNVTPGNIVFSVPAPVSGTAYGKVSFKFGSTEQAAIFQNTASQVAMSMLGSPIIYGSATATYLNAPSSQTAGFTIGGGLMLSTTSATTSVLSSTTLSLTPPTLSWVNSAVAPNVSQAALASTSAGSGAAGQPMSITAQAGEAATGLTNNGGAGGVLTLAAGAGGTSGSATAGQGGVIAFSSGVTVKQITITASTYTVDTHSTTSDDIVFTDSTSNTVTVTLPPPTAGRSLKFKDKTGKVTTHAVVVQHNASETIDGAASVTFTKNYDSLWLVSDGTNWAIMGEFSSSIVP